MPGEHALLSASGAKRWMACPPSARIEAEFPEEQSSFAAEGTLAHELGEAYLRYTLLMREQNSTVYDIDFNLSKMRGIEGHPLYQEEMSEYASEYANFVLERYDLLMMKNGNATLLIEQRLDYSAYAPEGFGTGDALIISDGTIEVIDLKYGKGVPVEAEDNPQMKLYALGAYEMFGLLYDIDSVRMTIYQPRIDNICTAEYSVTDLVKWGTHSVLPVATLAFDGKGEFHSGSHCKFCKIRTTCRERANENLNLARYEFRDPTHLEDYEIEDILDKMDALKTWAADIQQHAFSLALAGKHWERYKLVEGKSNRKYANQDAAALHLLKNGYDEAIIYNRELRGITDMEKFLGRKKFSELLSDFVIKPAGAPALVPITDKRDSIASSAKTDFT